MFDGFTTNRGRKGKNMLPENIKLWRLIRKRRYQREIGLNFATKEID